MLRTKQMTRLLLTGLKERMEPTIQELYLRHAFHIQEYVEGRDADFEGFVLGKPLPGAGPVSLDLVRLRGVITALGLKPDEVTVKARPKASDVRGRMAAVLPPLEGEVEALLTRRRETLEPRARQLGEEIAALTPFAVAPLDLEMYRGYTSLAVFAGRIARDVDVPFPHEKFFGAEEGGNFIALFVRSEDRPQAEALLQEARFQPLAIPGGSGSPKERLGACEGELAGVKKEMEQIEARLGEIRGEKGEFLLACEEILAVEAQKAEVPLRFATSPGTFVAEGWVPTARVPEIKEAVARVSEGRVYVTEIETDHDDKEVPVEYENPSFARPTEFLTDLHSRPRYSEIDPTVTIAIIFPIFFGLILGDIGYGALLLVAVLVLGRMLTSPDMRKFLAVLRNCSISSIIFGVLFSECFGFEMPWTPVFPSRHLLIGAVEGEGGAGPNIPGLMILSIWIAIAQITLGRVLNAVNQARGHHGIKGILAQLGWIACMWGILVLIWSMVAIPYMPDLTTLPGIIAGLSASMVLGAVLLIAGIAFIASESVLELIEIPTIISNSLSYTRLAAVGLSSVAIALVINFMAIGMLIEPQLANLTPIGIVFIIIGVVLFIAGHLGNAALGLLGGALQSLRLQYVEYFTKFYKGGGKRYNPFGMEKKFSED
jgi:V/A-type H+/Na+-transporting ATPase subunit I